MQIFQKATHMRPVISFTILLLLFCTASCNHQAAQAPVADTLSFIMAGQSNMAGRGIVAPEDTATDPRLLEMDDAFHYMLKSEPNKLYQGWLAGLDCGHSFGGELLRHLPAQTAVGLIQCSVSSTAMKHWLGDSLGIYTNLVSRARAGAASGPVKGLLWMQGEGDADDAVSAAAYGQALSTFIRRLRAMQACPPSPFT